MRLAPPTNAQEAENNCIMSKRWDTGKFQSGEPLTKIEARQCNGPWIENENGQWIQGSSVGDPMPASPTTPTVTTTTTATPSGTTTAGFMGLPKVAWIAIIGVGVYYAYSKGMLKKLIK